MSDGYIVNGVPAGGGSLPTATAAGQPLVSTGAGATYAATWPWPDGTDSNDVLVVVPSSTTVGAATFTDLTGRHTPTAVRAINDPFRGRVGRSAVQLGHTPFQAGPGALLIPQSDDFYFPAYDAGDPHAADFTFRAVVTLFENSGVQRPIALGKFLSDGSPGATPGAFCAGFNGQDVNIALTGHGGETTISGSFLPPSALVEPIEVGIARYGNELRIGVAGVIIGTATYTQAFGIQVSGSPDPAKALIFGARNPGDWSGADFSEPVRGGLLHAVQVSRVCRYT